MLTKEHLKFRIRAGRVSPAKIAQADPAALALAGEMVDVFRAAEGSTHAELDESLASYAANPLAAAFKKLLLDGCEVEDDDGSIAKRRWQWLKVAQTVRQELSSFDAQSFAQAVSAKLSLPMDELRDGLYADLPACRRIVGVKPPSPAELLDRYNLAQVQGLILRARTLELYLPKPSLSERRFLFRQLKFHRLLVDVAPRSPRDGASSLRLTLSGPMGIFDQAATYGLRLATFFPYVLHLGEWELRASLLLRDKEVEFTLDHKVGLVSHYKTREPYIPAELTACMDDFHAKHTAWRIAPGAELLPIGRQSYCFPNLTISHEKAGKIHVELFHRWHAGQLAQRLEALDKNPISGLFLGIERSLSKRAEVASELARRGGEGARCFIFSGFPTPRALSALLPKD